MLQRIWFAKLWWLAAALAMTASADADEISGPITADALAQQALDDVASRIRTATTQPDSAWASQPGAIRAFGTSEQIHKLYSSDEPIVNNSAAAIDDVPQDAISRLAQFVDLNAPTADAEGVMRFPIADPRAYRGQMASDSTEGFRYQDTIDGVVEPGAAPSLNQRLPMPVRWLYVLQDGTCGHLDADDKFVGTNPATTANPIVARYAYWTDDESCKINVNTASEAAHWDMPRADTPQERAYAEFQPAGKEYQRIPGHPATVCLSSVLFPGKRYPESLTLAETKQLWRLTPEVSSSGGSEGGTRRVLLTDMLIGNGDPHSDVAAFIDSADLPDASRDRAQQSRFLLTTESEAPAQNLHGLPRVLTWPVRDTGPVPASGNFPIQAVHSVNDRRMMALGTTFADQYYVQRRSPGSRHGEFYNGSRGSNVRLFQHIKALTERPIAGYGSSLSDKYGTSTFSERDTILNSTLDYLRTTNTKDPTINLANTYNSINGQTGAGYGQVSPFCLCGGTTPHRTLWTSELPYGNGRNYIISEVALVFMARAVNPSGGGAPIGPEAYGIDVGKKLLEVGLVIEMFSPTHGYATIAPDMTIAVGGATVGSSSSLVLPTYLIDGDDLGNFPNQKLIAGNNNSLASFLKTRPWGAHGGTRLFSSLPGSNSFLPDYGLYWEQPGQRPANNSEISYPNAIPESATTMLFTGSQDPLAIRLYDTGSNDSFNNLLQEYLIAFDNPQTPGSPLTLPTPNIDPGESNTWRWKRRVERALVDPSYLIQPGDVVRSFVVRHGDARLVAGRRLLDADTFVPHPDFSDPTKKFAHSLTMADGSKHHGFSSDRGFVSGASYVGAESPDLPISPSDPDFAAPPAGYPFSTDPTVSGDWDNGIGAHPDGAYINYPDGIPFLHESDGISYFDQIEEEDVDSEAILFSTKRIIPSPGIFGSLPTGIRSHVPWRTLLFRPDPQHYGASELPDHLWMDLFRMPTVEPEGISSKWADKGKVNLNYQILPFTYIERSTAMHALLKSERMLAIPTSAAQEYKTEGGPDYRFSINADTTLLQVEDRFADGDIFRSATEICELYLVPDAPGAPVDRNTLGAQDDGDYPSMRAFWQAHALTGDNSKERPYTALYSNVTTRSNRFQVHVKAQTISKSQDSPADTFDPQSDAITDEVSGNGFVTRRIVDAAVPGYMTAPNAPRLDYHAVFDTELAEISRPRPHRIIQVTIDESTGFLPKIEFEVAIDHDYAIERSGDLINWTQIDTHTANGALNSYTDTTGTIPEGSAHYRIRQF